MLPLLRQWLWPISNFLLILAIITYFDLLSFASASLFGLTQCFPWSPRTLMPLNDPFGDKCLVTADLKAVSHGFEPFHWQLSRNAPAAVLWSTQHELDFNHKLKWVPFLPAYLEMYSSKLRLNYFCVIAMSKWLKCLVKI